MPIAEIERPLTELGTATGSLADLILVRLLPSTKSQISPAKLRNELSPFFQKPLATELVDSTLTELRHSQFLPSKGQVLTEAGQTRALQYLGLSEWSPKWNWPRIKNQILVPKALGVSFQSADTGDKLAAVLIKKKLGLPVATGNSMSAVLDALACRVLGFPDCTKLDYRAAILSQYLNETNPLKTDDLKKAIPAKELGAKGTNSLRMLALKGFAESSDRPAEHAVEHPFDLESFANTVLSVARRSTLGRFGDNKVFISSVWQQLKGEPAFASFDLDGFKSKLLEAHRANLLALSRADLVQVMNQDDVNDSEIQYLNTSFHFIVIDRG